jgi:hypothetical protein
LLKRVDGLEAQLKEKKSSGGSPMAEQPPPAKTEGVAEITDPPAPDLPPSSSMVASEPKAKRAALDTSRIAEAGSDSIIYSAVLTNEPSLDTQLDALLDTYFTRFHGKPYYILDESSVRQRLQLNQLPPYLVHAIYAVAAR